MFTRRPVRAAALAAVLAAGLTVGLTACGQDGAAGSGGPNGSGGSGGSGRGRLLGPEERSVTLAVGERFTVAVRDNSSAGDRWSVADPKPDAAVAALADEQLDLPKESKTSDGVGGTRFYTFEAKGGGTTAVTLLNCFRGYCNLPTTGEENRKLVVRNTYTVTVR
ncbi:protease inhibitor I42 family protein [Kitasatospora sp. NPDC092039]|uniref:protease inhibitor I42 family protein n=1 Tax=Kitasatospora sp. NPDC092039 TaxID=3364086 RepID=UPI0038282ED8